jgi:hypothetical protein
MIERIIYIIENKDDNFFEFNVNSLNPVKHLKDITNSVPERPGIYLVFTNKNEADFCEDYSHLNFFIDHYLCELVYFGKAGGLTTKGRLIRQGLKGRINNVVSDSGRNLKDVPRAVYWNVIMNDHNFQTLKVIFFEHNNPQNLENEIYAFLDANNRKYPLMNKRRGR